MPRKNEPQGTEHKGSIRVRWKGEEYYFGPWDRAESWRAFEAWKADVLNGGGTAPMTVADVAAQYWDHVQVYYRHPNGDPTPEQASIRTIVDKLLAEYGHTAVTHFGTRDLKAFRDALVKANRCRKSINKEIGRIKRMFKWAASEPIIGPEVWQRLAVVTPLAANRSPAPERDPIEPVAWPVVELTLPYLSPPLQAAVWVQGLTGCRPDEALRLRACDLDRSGDVWVYSPTCPQTGKPRHKTAWRGKAKHIPIVPALQAILEPWLETCTDPTSFLFSPAKWMAEYRGRHAAPKPRPKKKRKVDREPGEKYTSSSYAKAVAKACAKAQQAWHPPLVAIPRWAPNQIRHLVATEVERSAGIQAAQKLLGHASATTTQGYVQIDVEAIKQIALGAAGVRGKREV